MKKRIFTTIFAFILAMSATFSFTGCSLFNKSFTVTFDGNGGTLVSGEVQQTVSNARNLVPPVFEKDGFYFLDWDCVLGSINKDTTVKALWQEYILTVEFRVEGGTHVSGELTQKVNVGTQLVEPIFERAGYTLSWDREIDLITESTVVNGIWSPIEYKINVLDKDGNPYPNISKIKVNYERKVPELPSNIAGSEDRILAWKVQGTEDEYIEKGQMWKYLEDKTIEPVIGGEDDVYRIVYDLNGGKSVKNPHSFVGLENQKLTNPERDGYIFMGWKVCDEDWMETEGAPQKDFYVDGKNVESDLYLIAKWTPEEFVVHFKTSFGTMEDGLTEWETTMTYGKTIDYLPTISDTDAQFIGWSYKGSILAVGDIWTDADVTYDEQVMVYANFSNAFKIELDLTFDLKLSNNKLKPEWDYTPIDDKFSYLHITCKVDSEVKTQFLLEDINDLILPEARVLTPAAKQGELAEFAFGGKWRVYLDQGYVDIRLSNGKITQYTSGGDVVRGKENMTLEQLGEVLSTLPREEGVCKVVFRPYCIKDWT